jgi:hypothetical protein
MAGSKEMLRVLRDEAPFAQLANQFVIVGMGADPEPKITIIHCHGQRAIAQADSNGPITAGLLELQRRDDADRV